MGAITWLFYRKMLTVFLKICTGGCSKGHTDDCGALAQQARLPSLSPTKAVSGGEAGTNRATVRLQAKLSGLFGKRGLPLDHRVCGMIEEVQTGWENGRGSAPWSCYSACWGAWAS